MQTADTSTANARLFAWNQLDPVNAAREILPCCGSHRWADELAARRPFHDVAALLNISDQVWQQLDPADWEEAFASHPRIGEKKAPASATSQSAAWSSDEQRGVSQVGSDTLPRLQQGNTAYEERFGRTYIVCATGKSADEMLRILEQRLQNNQADELREACENQRQITQLRLRKWLQL